MRASEGTFAGPHLGFADLSSISVEDARIESELIIIAMGRFSRRLRRGGLASVFTPMINRH